MEFPRSPNQVPLSASFSMGLDESLGHFSLGEYYYAKFPEVIAMSRRLFIEDKLEEFYSRCRASSEIKYWIKRGGIEINISLALVKEIVRCSMKSIQKKEQKNEIPIHRFEKTRHSSHGYITQFP